MFFPLINVLLKICQIFPSDSKKLPDDQDFSLKKEILKVLYS